MLNAGSIKIAWFYHNHTSVYNKLIILNSINDFFSFYNKNS